MPGEGHLSECVALQPQSLEWRELARVHIWKPSIHGWYLKR